MNEVRESKVTCSRPKHFKRKWNVLENDFATSRAVDFASWKPTAKAFTKLDRKDYARVWDALRLFDLPRLIQFSRFGNFINKKPWGLTLTAFSRLEILFYLNVF